MKLSACVYAHLQGNWYDLRQFEPVVRKPLGTPREPTAKITSTVQSYRFFPLVERPSGLTAASKPRLFSRGIPGAGEAALIPPASGWCEAWVHGPMHPKLLGKLGPHPSVESDNQVLEAVNQGRSTGIRARTSEEKPVTAEAARETFVKGLHKRAWAARDTASVPPWRYYAQDAGGPLPKAVVTTKAAAISASLLSAQRGNGARISWAREREVDSAAKAMCRADRSAPTPVPPPPLPSIHQGVQGCEGSSEVSKTTCKSLTWHDHASASLVLEETQSGDFKHPAVFTPEPAMPGAEGQVCVAGAAQALKYPVVDKLGESQDEATPEPYCDFKKRASMELEFFQQYERQNEFARSPESAGCRAEQEQEEKERERQHRGRHPPAPASVFFY